MKHNCMNKMTSISEKRIWESTRQSGLKEDLNGILMYPDIVHWFLVAFLIVSFLSELVVSDLSLFQILLLPA